MPNTCFVIGEGTLLIDCTTMLGQQGFLVKGVISQDPQVAAYCQNAGLRYVDSASPWAAVLDQEPFDFLFSIVNRYILPEKILRLPQRHTINYHDGPLPTYAGVNATFWALVNGEKTHGITWHLVDAGIDTGAIVKQQVFPIDADDTSISLNVKCYAAAVDSFRELIDDLAMGSLTVQPQDVSRRSYYGRKKRPDLLINWTKPAYDSARLHRALDFGFHANPFGYLKIWAANRFWLVKHVTATTTPTQPPPGTIEAILPESLLVATSDFLLNVGAFHTPDGEPVSMDSFLEQTGLTEGQLLGQPAPEVVQTIAKADAQCARHQSYWVTKLAQWHPTTLPYPVSPNVTNDQKATSEQIAICLPTAVEAALATTTLVSKTDQVLTALLITLARLNNQPSVSVGYQSPISQQLATDTAGIFTDYLPFGIDFDWESGFEAAVTSVQQEQSAVNKHLTFARDSLMSQPVLQAMAPEFRQTGFPIVICREQPGADYSFPKKALTVVLADDATYRIVFNPNIWSFQWVTDLVKRWMILLESGVCQPTQSLKSVSLLTGEEQGQMLMEWNATAVAYPRDRTVHQLIEEQAQLRPQAEALRCGDVALTYEQLNQRANQLAGYLQKQGVTSDTLVGICVERSPEMIISLLAILKAGGAYVPLDPNYPAARLNELVTQTDVHYVISRKNWLDRLPAEKHYVLLDEDRPLITQQSNQNLDIPINAEQLAYVLFTSGSTGRSKAVAIPHRGIVRTVRGTNCMRLDETIRMLGLAPLAFDASTLEIWGSLANGGQLVLVAENPPSLEAIKQTIQAQSVNAAFFTAALFNVLVDSGISELTTLTQLSTGGEAASAEHVFRAQRQLLNCELVNGYGPTESTTFASFYNMSTGNWGTGSVPIGRPVSNTQLYIVDTFLNPMPVGLAGELLIGGDGLARGYLNQPELTKQKFVPNPFSTQPGSRLYRTGDQARYLSDGTIEFLGRLDDQLKIRGFRIEPGEIEQALCQHPTVGAAVVLADELASGMKRLVAYLVPRSGMAIETDTLRAFLKASLPDYLIPNVLVPIEAIPLTANGKADKSKLPSASQVSQQRQSDLLTPTEQVMEPLWASVLNLPTINGSDHFFDLGGSSLMAIQLISLISQKFGLRLSMSDVFKHPTLRQLSTYVDQLPRQEIPLIVAPSAEADSSAQFPLSFAQNRLWIIEQLHDLQGVYNVPIILRIQGDLDPLILQKSLNEIIRRHDSLRTTFGHINGLPFQKIGPVFSIEIPVCNLTAEPNQSLDQWLTEEVSRSFDLAKGPLVRASVAQLSGQSWVFLMVFHHIIYDGLSTRVLANELRSLYLSLLRSEPVSLPQLPLQYTDFAQWQVDHDTPESLKRERDYWKKQLANVPPLLNLPADTPRPPIQSFAGADYSFTLPDPLWQLVKTGLQRPGTTVFLRLLAVFAVWLHQVAKTTDVVIGIPVAGRNRSELNELIGFFVNTVVIRLEVTADLTFRQLLRNVRQLALDAYDHQALPFEQVVEELKPLRTLAYSPVVQVVFNFQEDNSDYWKLDELEVEEVQFDKNMAKFDLQLSCHETATGMAGTFNYRTDLFTDDTVAQMAQSFIQVLEQVVTQPDQPLTSLLQSNVTPYASEQNISSESVKSAQYVASEPLVQELDKPLVSLLEQIWSEHLGMSAIGLDDDFFGLGGHSLLALQMTAVIQDRTGYKLPITGLFANPTLRRLTTYLATTQTEEVWHSLISVNNVKPTEDRRALYLIHPLSGDVGYAYYLAPYISDKQPIYGLQAIGLDGISEPLRTVEEMAAHYVQLVIRHQPEGPFSLGGYSLGGIIAFEMARQLKQIGREADLVLLIDAYPLNPDPHNHTKLPIRQLLPHYYYYWRSLPKHPNVLLPVLQKKVPWVSQYLLSRFWKSLNKKAAKPTSSFVDASIIDPDSALVKSFRQAYSKYQFKPYDGKVVFLRVAKEDMFGTNLNKVDFGWGRYARKGVEIHQLFGHHNTLFSNDETVKQIAEIIQSYLTL